MHTVSKYMRNTQQWYCNEKREIKEKNPTNLRSSRTYEFKRFKVPELNCLVSRTWLCKNHEQIVRHLTAFVIRHKKEGDSVHASDDLANSTYNYLIFTYYI